MRRLSNGSQAAMYSAYSKTWRSIFKEKAGDISSRVIELRRQPTLQRLDRPSRLDRARRLGYKAKQGVIVVRIRVSRGGMRRQRPRSGRRPKHMGVLRIKSSLGSQKTAERRVGEKYPNMRLVGSYLLWRDGRHIWYECVLLDPAHPSIRADAGYRRSLGLVSPR
jgi:large subunit ribosomal protein L15e